MTKPTDTTTDAVRAAWTEHRAYVLRVATRILGSDADAEDVVQEAFGRLARVGPDAVDDVRGWLAVVVRHLCLDRIRSAQFRHESSGLDALRGVPAGSPWEDADGDDPADRVTLDEQIQRALAVVLGRLTPAERTSFVLHDIFGFSFDDVGRIVGRTPAACRQLASRGRRSIREGSPPDTSADAVPTTSRIVTERFIAACDGGDLAGLMAVLDPDVVGVATVLEHDIVVRLEGAPAVARRVLQLFGPHAARLLVPIDVEQRAGLVVFDRGRVRGVIVLDQSDGRIDHISTVVRPFTQRVGSRRA